MPEMMNRNKNEPQFRYGEIRLRAAEEGQEESRQVELSLSSEEPYLRWFGTEILSHDSDAIDTARLSEIGVMLFNHNVDYVLGKVVSVELDEEAHKLRAVVEFDDDEESEKIYQKVKSGTLKGVSVGYRVSVWEDVEAGATSTNGRFNGPCSVAIKWEPMELSIVSVPADPTVGVGRSFEALQNEQNGDVNEMPKINEQAQNVERTATITEPTPPTPAQSEGATREAGIQQERQRVQEISNLCRQFNIDAEPFISDGSSVEDTRAAVLERLAKERTPQNITVQADETDKFRAAATDGLAIRAGITVEKPAAGAENFRGKSLIRLAAECCERFDGVNTTNMGEEEIIRAALTGSGQFPGILSNTANKSMAQAYQTAPTTFQLWAGKGSNADFKAATRYRLSEADELEEITENGEFTNAEVSEASATASIATYGRSFSLTRKAMINDDLGALSTIPALYGAAARRMINKMVYAILTSNPTIEGAALFHNDHKNLSAEALSVAGLGKVKAKMARQKNIGGKEALNIQPAFLIVPPELEVAAVQLISSAVDPTKANQTPNPFANRLNVVSDPELTTATEFYLAAAFGLCPTIEVTYLNGVETPTMESAVQFDTLGIKWRIYHDVGVNLLDFRGLAKSTGA